MNNNLRESDLIFKLLLCGDSGVGKTTILSRVTNEYDDENYIPTATIGVDFKTKTYIIDDKSIKLQLWDTAGQEQFRSIVNCYYKCSQGIILVFDLENRDSFHHLPFWLEEIKNNSRNLIDILLVGNKSDSTNRNIFYEEAYQCATSNGMDYIETSSLKNINCDQCFLDLAKQIYNRWTKEYNLKKEIDWGLPVENKLQLHSTAIASRCCTIS